MNKIVGIDFGTSYTYIIKGTEGDFKNCTRIGSELYGDYDGTTRFKNDFKGIKTQIGRDIYGDWVVGCKVDEKLDDGEIIDKGNVETDIKKNLRLIAEGRKTEYIKSFTFVNGNDKLSITDIAEKFLLTIFKEHLFTNERATLKDVDKVVVGIPAIEGVGEEYKNLIREIFGKLISDVTISSKIKSRWFKEDIILDIIEEPVLAGLACVFGNSDNNWKIDTNNDILVVDIGGGTADYAILHNTDGKWGIKGSVGGGAEPAGKDIDVALQNEVLKVCGVEIDITAAMSAKEKLFLPKNDIIIRAHQKETRIIGEKPLDAVYDDYLRSGRRTILPGVKDSDGQAIKIAFNREAVENPPDYYRPPLRESWSKEERVVEFEETCEEEIKRKFINGPNGIEGNNGIINKIKQKGLTFGTVIFVGGTCNVHEIRNEICRVLGIRPINGKYFNGKSHYKADSATNVIIYNLAECGGQITSGNAVAMGALVKREQTRNLISIPEIKLIINNQVNNGKDIQKVILNEQIIEDNCGKEVPCSIAYFNPSKIWQEFRTKYPDKPFRLRFHLEETYMGKEPKRRPKLKNGRKYYFSIPLTDEQIGRGVHVYFISHKSEQGQDQVSNREGRFKLYVLINEKGKRNLEYSFMANNGCTYSYVIKKVQATIKYFKTYDIAFSPEDNANEDGTTKGGWCSPLNKEGFKNLKL